MLGQTIFALGYSMIFTAIILVVTILLFQIDISQSNLVGASLVLLSGSVSFIGVGIMGSTLPLLFPERGSQMTHVIIAMLLLVSGVYYPIEVLPQALQQVSTFSPATYVLTGVRAAKLEAATLGDLWSQIWPALLIGLFTVPFGLRIFVLAETYAKRTGKLHRNG